MALKEKLQSDLTQSMRDRDELRSGTIRMVLTAIKNEEVSGKEARELSDAEVITVLSREAKKRREAAEAYEQAGAKDRAATESKRAATDGSCYEIYSTKNCWARRWRPSLITCKSCAIGRKLNEI